MYVNILILQKLNRINKSKSLREQGYLVFEIVKSHEGIRQNELGPYEEAEVCNQRLDQSHFAF